MKNWSTFPAALGVWGDARHGRYSANIPLLPPDLAKQPVVTEDSAKPDGQPWNDPQRLRWLEKTRTVEFAPNTIPRAWMIAFWEVPDLEIGIIEKIATYAKVQALDFDGAPIVTFVLDGTNPTVGVIDHPDPVGGRLTIQWRLTGAARTSQPSSVPDGIYQGYLPGHDLIAPWSTDVNGWTTRWGADQQLIVDAQTRVRLWIQVEQSNPGVLPFWNVTATGRLGGYAQMRGPDRAALLDARTRS